MRIERLAEHHPRAAFESGNEVLDNWFHEHAFVAQRQDTARSFVLIDDDEKIVGYYSLAMGGVESIDAPRRLTRGLPRFPVPIVLLARLAIDQRFQGEGLGDGFAFRGIAPRRIGGRTRRGPVDCSGPDRRSCPSLLRALGFPTRRRRLRRTHVHPDARCPRFVPCRLWRPDAIAVGLQPGAG